MPNTSSIGAITLAAALCMTMAPAKAWDETKYPDWGGKWERVGAPRWVQGSDKAPLTPEYEKIMEWNTADQKAGGHGWEPSWACLPPGMPRVMNVYEPMEMLITPDTTYLFISHIHDNRRIFTDGRAWPGEIDSTYSGYSIGTWLDTDGDGKYDTLEVETRAIKGPRSYDTGGLPLHADNKTIVKERIYLDKADPKTMWDEITTIDNALTRPWTVKKKYARDGEPRPDWIEEVCSENNPHIKIQGTNYFLGADGNLMPSRAGQEPPDLRYFKTPNPK